MRRLVIDLEDLLVDVQVAFGTVKFNHAGINLAHGDEWRQRKTVRGVKYAQLSEYLRSE